MIVHEIGHRTMNHHLNVLDHSDIEGRQVR